jgi:aquaporin TIP
MPGILEQPAEDAPSARWYAALAAEFVGLLLFTLLGSVATASSAALANGFLLAVLVYCAANVSGGHLNPAVTLASAVTGHTSISRALAYWGAQLGGASAGALLLRVMLPHGGPRAAAAVGCFGPASGATLGQAFGWELCATCLLVLTVYAVAVGEPSFGTAAPMAIGLAVAAGAFTAGRLTGGAMNPARVLGPAIASGTGCGSWTVAMAYVAAQLLGGLAAAVASAPLYGLGLELGAWRDVVRERAGAGLARGRGALAAGYERVEGAVEGAAEGLRERLHVARQV